MEEKQLFEKRGSRLEANKVKVRVTKNGQYSVTLPRAIAMAAGLKKGSIVNFEFLKQGGIKINSWEASKDVMSEMQETDG